MPILFDHSTAPLVRIRYVDKFSDEEFERHLLGYGALLDAGQRYGIVFDAMHAAVPTPRQRAMQAEWMRARKEELTRLCVAGAFAIGSPLVRGALTAILWLQPTPFPHQVFGSTTEAELWIRSKLFDAGVLAR